MENPGSAIVNENVLENDRWEFTSRASGKTMDDRTKD